MYISAISSLFHGLRLFSNIASTNTTESSDALPFLLNIILAISIVISIYFGKKYLYNFSYFNLSRDIIEDENLIATSMFSYLPEDYEDVPEPYKLQIPNYILIGFSGACFFVYLSYYIIPILSFFPMQNILENIHNFYIYIQRVPLFNTNLLPVLSMAFYSYTMYFQIKHYKKYYNNLIKESSENLDLTNELHEK